MPTIEEASELLRHLGLPPAQRNEISALTLLTLCGLSPGSTWSAATQKLMRVHDIKEAMRTDWQKSYAENTRETIRRQVLHQFLEAGVVDLNPGAPTLPTNSPRTRYALSSEALVCAQAQGSEDFAGALARFEAKFGSLEKRSRKDHGSDAIPVHIPDGQRVQLSPGAHNEVQRAIVEKFLPRFVPGGRVLYMGDTANKQAFVDESEVRRILIDIGDHGKLPDVIILVESRKWLVLVEAVTSHGPVTPVREMQLRRLFEGRGYSLIFITAFPDRAEFRRHLADIAWETEVWIVGEPEHLVHFNGDRFLGAYTPKPSEP